MLPFIELPHLLEAAQACEAPWLTFNCGIQLLKPMRFRAPPLEVDLHDVEVSGQGPQGLFVDLRNL